MYVKFVKLKLSQYEQVAVIFKGYFCFISCLLMINYVTCIRKLLILYRVEVKLPYGSSLTR